MRVAIIGAALSANKGAAAMAESVIAELPRHIGPCEFDLLTTYPAQDRQVVDSAVRVVSLTPPHLAAVHVPLGAVAGLVRRLHLPHRWLLRTEALRALDRSDVVVDVAGISFVDGRGLPTLGYNTLMTGLPLLLGRPVVKTAQALGPFRQRLNRLCARLVLPRLACVCARGKGTREYLDELGLDNVIDAADLAFALPEEAELPRDLAALLDEHVAERGFVLVMPSQVVANLCEKAGIDYVPGLASAVDAVNAKLGLPVVIVPHSYRSGQGRSRMNDGPVAREVAAACTAADVHLVDADLRPGVLRAMVDRSSLLVTSRFHGMVSGMATATPTVVIGWSHKYREVMSDFGVERYGLSHEALATPSSVVDTVVDAWGAREDLHRSMRAALDGVRSAAAHNFEAVAAALPEGDRP